MSNHPHPLYAQMFEAYRNADFETVNTLLKTDEDLKAFSQYTFILAATGKEAALKTSLNLPNLDKNSPYYKRMVLDLALTAAHEARTNILDIVLPLAEKPAENATSALSRIFNSMAPGHSPCPANTDASIGKYLIEKGADVAKAVSLSEGQLTSQIKQMGKSLKNIRRYKNEISGGKAGCSKKTCDCSKKTCG
jgi:hypothetical protein